MILKNLKNNELIDIATRDEQCVLTSSGALASYTSPSFGRSPNAKKISYDTLTKEKVCWKNNKPITEAHFEMYEKMFEDFRDNAFKRHGKTLFHQEVRAVRDPRYKLDINIWTQYAKHSLFARNMFLEDPENFSPVYELYHFPTLTIQPMVLISFEKRKILISGTLYSGEIKKSIFTVLNYWFPEDYNFLPMHWSVNTDTNRKNPAIFFGLSGTGKTTLSSDKNRILIGDDEHGWTDKGIVNFEGGCYAKTINLSKEDEPQIWAACHKPGTTLENVPVYSGIPDFNDKSITENGRASYSTTAIDNADNLGYVDEHPKNIIMLTCDTFGVLPPVSRLTSEEAVKQFLLGYTSKIAGTEQGVSKPQATFSPCFGLPFMPLPPERYASILKEKIENHDVKCWLVNTGWTGGPYGTGKRIPLKITRKIIDFIHAVDENLENETKYTLHKTTGFRIPDIEGVDKKILIPEKNWKSIKEYNYKAAELLKSFES